MVLGGPPPLLLFVCVLISVVGFSTGVVRAFTDLTFFGVLFVPVGFFARGVNFCKACFIRLLYP